MTVAIPAEQVTELEQRLLQLHNQERMLRRVPIVKPLDELFETAQDKANVLAQIQQLQHVIPGFPNPYEQVREDGVDIDDSFFCENIGRFGPRTSPEYMVRAWLNSPPHKRCMLSQVMTHAGIGVAIDESGRQWAAVHFARVL